MLHGQAEGLHPPRPAAAAVGHQGLQQTHRVGALAVAHRLDVGVARRMERRCDGHAAGQVQRRVDLVFHCADDGFGVGAGEHTEAVRQLWQGAAVLHLVQQVLGAPGTGRQDDVPRREGPAVLTQGPARAHGVDLPDAAGTLPHGVDRRQRMHCGTGALGQPEVVLQQRVLGAVATARHAAAAFDAPGAVRSDATEERVPDRLAGWSEEHADRRLDECVAHAHVLGDRFHDLVGRGHARVDHHPEHAPGLVVERRQLVGPVRDVGPLRVVEERRGWLVEGIGVVQRPAADARPGQDDDVPQHVDALYAVAAQLGRPHEFPDVPTGFRELVVGEPAAGLQNADAVALLGQPQRRHAAPESGPDDDHVIVGVGHALLLSWQ